MASIFRFLKSSLMAFGNGPVKTQAKETHRTTVL